MNLEQQNIIGLLGIADLPDEKKVAIVEKATDLVQKRLLVRFFDSLSQEDQEKFKQLLDADKDDEINEFIVSRVPNFPTWIEEETLKVKQSLADLFK